MFKLFILTLAVVAVSAGRLPREAPPSTNQALLESGLNIAQDGVKKLEEIATNLLNVNSTESLKETGADIWEQVKSLASTITKTTQEWTENGSIKELREITGVEDFKANHPDLSAAVTDSVDSLNKVANDIILKLKTMVDDKDVKELSNVLIETTSNGINAVKEQLKETTHSLAEHLKSEASKDPATE